MWIELGIPRPGVVPATANRVWVNTDHIVRAEFLMEGDNLTVTVVSTKPGGSDRTVFSGDDAKRIKLTLEREGCGWQPLLDYELKAIAERQADIEAAAALKVKEQATKKGKK